MKFRGRPLASDAGVVLPHLPEHLRPPAEGQRIGAAEADRAREVCDARAVLRLLAHRLPARHVRRGALGVGGGAPPGTAAPEREERAQDNPGTKEIRFV